ncbi:4a-hydroxytetrahydrobiopterin dehydratase [Salinisphaera sp.]|uniref:4a-hydroxytetrahydrobiopterin dehydratase n=1 Tax=Salinisphaera sp. TaxID=1914330 RepID=UPI000C6595B0|nr:4a-hydroxytetrahydrobiopterin dehydratase [Salinisphaera sp.]MAS08594.1 4a-hydroxytetrahydrobiopterin dehydratase [Salinisphaera sp.]|tara:strand:- start:180 stop:515 length:336 start_codon:yes stop_codon:yes gene_type:complete
MTDLHEKQCQSCSADTPALNSGTVASYKAELSNRWTVVNDDTCLEGTFKFKDYYRTQAFVNAVAFIAHREDHHPDISFGYNKATIHLTTHAINALSDNDFICAAKIDRLLD